MCTIVDFLCMVIRHNNRHAVVMSRLQHIISSCDCQILFAIALVDIIISFKLISLARLQLQICNLLFNLQKLLNSSAQNKYIRHVASIKRDVRCLFLGYPVIK